MQREQFSQRDSSRITLRLSPEVRSRVPVEFRFNKPAVRLTLGQATEVDGVIHNLSSKEVMLEFTQDMSPAAANEWVVITKCFCSEPLKLAAEESRAISMFVEIKNGFKVDEDVLYLRMLADNKILDVIPLTKP